MAIESPAIGTAHKSEIADPTHAADGGNLMSRRDTFKLAGRLALQSSAIAGINIGVLAYSYFSRQLPQAEQSIRQSTSDIQNEAPLQTKDFAPHIAFTANFLAEGNSNDLIPEIALGTFAANMGIGLALKDQSEEANRLTGSVALTTARTLDIISTVAFTRYHKDPRFKEYGFDAFSQEANPIFPANPSPEIVVGEYLIFAPLMLYGGWKYPMTGRNYLGAVPFITQNNYKGAYAVKMMLDMGDDVKDILKNDGNADVVFSYLRDRIREGKNAPEALWEESGPISMLTKNPFDNTKS